MQKRGTSSPKSHTAIAAFDAGCSGGFVGSGVVSRSDTTLSILSCSFTGMPCSRRGMRVIRSSSTYMSISFSGGVESNGGVFPSPCSWIFAKMC